MLRRPTEVSESAVAMGYESSISRFAPPFLFTPRPRDPPRVAADLPAIRARCPQTRHRRDIYYCKNPSPSMNHQDSAQMKTTHKLLVQNKLTTQHTTASDSASATTGGATFR